MFPGPRLQAARAQLEADERAFGRDHPATMFSRYNYAEALSESDPAEAERLHRQVLAWKEASAGPESVAAGTSLNSLGVLARRRGALAEAEALLRRALAIREAQPHPRDAFDASVTRDELGCCLQAAGRAAEAREVRLRRGPTGLVCSHARCSKTPAQAGAPLKACTRCRAIWYCCKECQRADWTAGHKAVCEPHPELQPQA